MQQLLNSIGSEGFLDAHVIDGNKYFSRTYRVFNELKIIIMGNYHDVLGAFLLELTQ